MAIQGSIGSIGERVNHAPSAPSLPDMEARATLPAMAEPAWLTIARELQAIGQIGLAYAKDAFDKERYDRVLTLAASLMCSGSGAELEPVLDLFRQETGYATPKVDVRGAAFVDGRILMVRARSRCQRGALTSFQRRICSALAIQGSIGSIGER
ncbi:MAG: NUDIX hydrolase, partial [Deltaproteobacteria bacterium]